MRQVCIERVKTRECVNLNRPVFKIGKDETFADFAVADNRTVSRRHAEIFCREGQWFLCDLGSKNGTYVNKKRVMKDIETRLSDGDEITFSNERFIFHL